MIRAVFKDGVLQPLDPVPSDWTDGRELVIEEADGPTHEEESLDEWYQALLELGPARYEPGEREETEAILKEADESAKECVRREMGLP